MTNLSYELTYQERLRDALDRAIRSGTLRTLGDVVPEHDPIGFAGTVLTNDDPDISPVWKAVCRALIAAQSSATPIEEKGTCQHCAHENGGHYSDCSTVESRSSPIAPQGDTPRTDPAPNTDAFYESIKDTNPHRAFLKMYDHARQLQRELASKREFQIRLIERADKAERELVAARSAIEEHKLLVRIADANVIFPSLCANNNDAYSINDALAKYKTKRILER